MSWWSRLTLSLPLAIAATLNILGLIARPLHWRTEPIAGYCFLFATPWGWLLDNGWIGSVNSKWLDAVIAYAVILWIPAVLYSCCLWLLICAGRAVRRRLSP